MRLYWNKESRSSSRDVAMGHLKCSGTNSRPPISENAHDEIGPTASYGILLIWENLAASNLETLNRVRAYVLKKKHETARLHEK